jgi:hypothetical protein
MPGERNHRRYVRDAGQQHFGGAAGGAQQLMHGQHVAGSVPAGGREPTQLRGSSDYQKTAMARWADVRSIAIYSA